MRDDLYGNCPFESQIKDWLKFDSDKWTIHDATVAAMITILGVTPTRKKTKQRGGNSIKLDLKSLVNVHKL